MIEVTCDGCGSSHSLPDGSAGASIECPNCGKALQVPGEGEPAWAPPDEQPESSGESPMAALQAAVAEVEHAEHPESAEAPPPPSATEDEQVPPAAIESEPVPPPAPEAESVPPPPEPEEPPPPPPPPATEELPPPPPPPAPPGADEGPPPPPAPGLEDDGIPMAQPVRTSRPLLIGLIAGGALVVAAGAVLAVWAFGGSGREEAMATAEARLAEARRLHAEAMAGSTPPEQLDDAALIERHATLRKAIAKYQGAEAVLTALDAAERDAEVQRFIQAVGERQALARLDLKRLADALWPGPGPDVDICERVSPSVPLVQKAGGRGSGFLIEHGGKLYVATNRHVIEDAKDGLVLLFPVGRSSKPSSRVSVRLKAESVTLVDRWEDLAVIHLGDQARAVRERRIRPLKLLPKGAEVKRMERIWVLGYPSTGEAASITATSTDGTVSNITPDAAGKGKSFQMSAAINPGNSGGPVFNGRGRVVGVATRVRRMDAAGHILEGQNFAVHVNQLRVLLDEPRFSVEKEEIARLLDPAAQLPKDLTQVTAEFAEKGFRPSGSQPLKSPKLLRLRPRQILSHDLKAKKGRTYRLLALYAATKQLGVVVYAKGDQRFEVDQSKNTIYRYVDFTPGADRTYKIKVANPRSRPIPAILTLFEKGAEG